MNQTLDIIEPEEIITLHALFKERAKRSPDRIAYRYHDDTQKAWLNITWAEMACEIARWQTALHNEGLKPGDRIAIWICNCKEWVIMDQAALGLGLIVVPLFCNDRPENVAYILEDAEARLLLIDDKDYLTSLTALPDRLDKLDFIVSTDRFVTDVKDTRLRFTDDWLPDQCIDIDLPETQADDLATIVYTSGTTGPPKGVELSHRNILWNARAGLHAVPVYQEDIFLSFLPLSHMFERTVGYYTPVISGSTVVYTRSIHLLAEDLKEIKPTLIVSVPRIFERVYAKVLNDLEKKPSIVRNLFHRTVEIGWRRFEYEQNRGPWQPGFFFWPILDKLVAQKIRDGFGGRIRAAVVGGAPLSSAIAKVFIGAGIPLLQGYGMTELGPVASVNLLDDNIPSSVGTPYKDVEVRTGDNDELLVRSPGVMLGYLNNDKATSETVDSEGWLHTGDKARIENGHVYITGRIKEIIVLANGEKLPPHDIEMAIDMDPVIDQVMVIGEGRPYLSALVVLNKEKARPLAAGLGLDIDNHEHLQDNRMEDLIIKRIASSLHAFPGYAKVVRVALINEPWTVENELITPTLKLRRHHILKRYDKEIHQLYEGH